jgi:5-deoxy-glucuronate isomerase
VGFRALRLAKGDVESLQTGRRELCLAILTGTVEVSVDGQTFPHLGTRDSVSDEESRAAVYVPSGKFVSIRAERDAEVTLCTCWWLRP